MCDQCEDISWENGRDEREAEIIALVQEIGHEWETEDIGGAYYTRSSVIEKIIELIKGEQK